MTFFLHIKIKDVLFDTYITEDFFYEKNIFLYIQKFMVLVSLICCVNTCGEHGGPYWNKTMSFESETRYL